LAGLGGTAEALPYPKPIFEISSGCLMNRETSDSVTWEGDMLSRYQLRSFFLLLALFLLALLPLPVPAQNSDQSQVAQIAAPLHRVEPPAAGASAEALEQRGDELEAQKNYLDAIDYHRAALRKNPGSASLLNKIGMSELLLRRLREARKSFEQALKADRNYANAYANLGVVYYQDKSYGKAIKFYDKAIALRPDTAVFYNNRGAAYFNKRQYEKASLDYTKALELDSDIFEGSARAGVQASIPSPEDRARYSYVLAKIYAKAGENERSLHYLKKAMEDGYKDIKNVYKDNEFSALRKDPRFAELMAARPPAIPD
jgi:tetratricopeptide (TPR) repeat protein